MSILRYNGLTATIDNVIGEPFDVENGKEYDATINIQQSPYSISVNGQQMSGEDTYWVSLNDNKTSIPYNKECLERQWTVVKV